VARSSAWSRWPSVSAVADAQAGDIGNTPSTSSPHPWDEMASQLDVLLDVVDSSANVSAESKLVHLPNASPGGVLSVRPRR
jgi:hypothetical protein